MGLLIKEKNGKYRVYSTIVDSYITEYLDKEGVVKYLFWRRFEEFVKNSLEDIVTFPNGWYDKEGKRFGYSEDKSEEYYSLIKNRNVMFREFLNKTKEMGISISMQDGGININNLGVIQK